MLAAGPLLDEVSDGPSVGAVAAGRRPAAGVGEGTPVVRSGGPGSRLGRPFGLAFALIFAFAFALALALPWPSSLLHCFFSSLLALSLIHI